MKPSVLSISPFDYAIGDGEWKAAVIERYLRFGSSRSTCSATLYILMADFRFNNRKDVDGVGRIVGKRLTCALPGFIVLAFTLDLRAR